MNALCIILQAKSNQAEASGLSLAELIGYGSTAFLVVCAIVSTRIVMECVREEYASPGIMGALLYGSTLVPAALIFLALYEVIPGEDWMLWFALVGFGFWFCALIGYTIYSAPKRKLAKARDAQRAAEQQAELYGGGEAQHAPAAPDMPGKFTPEDVIDAEEAPLAERTPRRAISIPASDSDSGRASEQTLKRMTLEKLEESNSGAPKPPRASEIPENPILPDEVVKIRCLACDKKMQAEGPKFMKQRRCPHCKAEPFRYVTAV